MIIDLHIDQFQSSIVQYTVAGTGQSPLIKIVLTITANQKRTKVQTFVDNTIAIREAKGMRLGVETKCT